MSPLVKQINKKRRHNRIRKTISGSAEKPRLVVYRSLKNNYAQLIDDIKRVTLIQVSDIKMTEKATKQEKAKKTGLELGKKAIEKNIKTCVFDRNGYRYHGRVKAIAEGAREGGLEF